LFDVILNAHDELIFSLTISARYMESEFWGYWVYTLWLWPGWSRVWCMWN